MDLIRKYSNRKLYHVRAARYLNFKDMRQLIRDGVEIKILQHETNADITHDVLTKILFQTERSKLLNKTTDELLTLIRSGDQSLAQS